jgi:membrane-associated phospholipid phosphatase
MINDLSGILRAYPIITSFSCVIGYFTSGNIDLLMLLVANTVNDLINNFLKYKICVPLMGDKRWGIFGYGTRPKGAKHCGIFVKPNSNGIPKGSYGMPSGHSQNAIFFTTYMILHLINSNYNTLTKNVGIGLFSFLGIMVMYSRVYFKCHTIQQVLIGGLIGGTLGALYFKNKDKLKEKIKKLF